jgi:ethanolamine utilization protein EutN
MLIGRVVGDITATRKHPSHEGRKILLVQPLNLDGTPRGNPVVAMDAVNAGTGAQVVLAQDGFAAFSALGLPPSPIDAVVIAIIDSIDLVKDALPAAAEAAPDKKPKRKTKAG